jgi:hypothetical protein
MAGLHTCTNTMCNLKRILYTAILPALLFSGVSTSCVVLHRYMATLAWGAEATTLMCWAVLR